MYNRLTDELAVCGFNTVRALSEVHPDKVNRLFIREDKFPFFTKLCKRLAERKRPYKICDDEELEKICKTNHHQGIVAMIYEPEIEGATQEDLDLWAAEGKTGILLCNIGNEHNLGAIVRSAAFFDASPIVLAGSTVEAAGAATIRVAVPTADGTVGTAAGTTPTTSTAGGATVPGTAATATAAAKPADGTDTTNADRVFPTEPRSGEGSPLERRLTTSAYRTAEGGMEFVDFRFVRSAASFLRSASKQLITIGSDPRARIRMSDLPKLIKNSEFGEKPGILLAIGNEETGLSKEEKGLCSIIARIPGTGNLDSLNAAQAATLFLHELYERRS
jgi:tRNA G18 (ribose-2'-O)-methylase SpoU